jgi:8-oxo-dGTP pyrophosphatase MutT (NUDIX family)
VSQKETINKNIIYPQSAVIPFQIESNQIRILLITSINTKKWIFPKGIIEEHLTPQQSALQEAFEEAGVEGEVINFSLGGYSYSKWGGICKVTVFPMRVTKVLDEWPEAGQRKRKWVSIDKAIKLLSKEELKNLLLNFEQNIKKMNSVKIFPEPK